MVEIVEQLTSINYMKKVVIMFVSLSVIGPVFSLIGLPNLIKQIIVLVILIFAFMWGNKSLDPFQETTIATLVLMIFQTITVFFSFATKAMSNIYLNSVLSCISTVCAFTFIILHYSLCTESAKIINQSNSSLADFIDKLYRAWIVYLIVSHILILIFPNIKPLVIVLKSIFLLYIYLNILIGYKQTRENLKKLLISN